MSTGRRPLNCWGDGDLPAPYAEGDIIDVPPGAKALERMDNMPPGRYKIVAAYSIDDGDAWYFRLGKWMTKGAVSDRLHVAYADRCSPDWKAIGDTNWLEGCTLVRTVDPDGWWLRERLLLAGWKPVPLQRVPNMWEDVVTLDPDDLVHTWCDTHAPTRTFCGLWPTADMCEDADCDNGPVCPICDDLQCGCEL